MSGRIKALWLLALALLRTVLRLLFVRRRDGLAMFRQNYEKDGLPPVSAAERAALPAFSRCIACGICDRGEGERIKRSGGRYPGLMQLVLAGSRSMPDYRAAAHAFAFVPDEVLEEKERVCPTDVPFRSIARFVRDKAAELGGPLQLPPPSSGAPRTSASDASHQ